MKQHPKWYADNYDAIQRFLALSDEERNQLKGQASGVYGTLVSSLTPAHLDALLDSGRAFRALTMTVRADLSTMLKDLQPEDALLLMLGVAVETMGIQQLKLEEAQKS